MLAAPKPCEIDHDAVRPFAPPDRRRPGPARIDGAARDHYSGIHSDADAFLTVWYGKTGYWAPTIKPDYAPQIILGVKLTDAHTFETLFFKTFDVAQNASQVSNANVEAIMPDEKYRYSSFDLLMEHFDESVQGLLDGETQIATHAAQHMKPIAAAPAASAP